MKKIFIIAIGLYQKTISPLLPKSCKYYPSCSNYAIDALDKHGLVRGGAKAAWRIMRCNPWAKGGYDPA